MLCKTGVKAHGAFSSVSEGRDDYLFFRQPRRTPVLSPKGGGPGRKTGENGLTKISVMGTHVSCRVTQRPS